MTEIASRARRGKGTIVKIETAANSGVFFEVGELTSVPMPTSQVAEIDVSNMQSPDDTAEFISGMKTYDDMALPMNWDPGGDTDEFILEWEVVKDRRLIEITWPGGAKDTFPAIYKGYSGEAPFGDKMTATLTVKPAGAKVRS